MGNVTSLHGGAFKEEPKSIPCRMVDPNIASGLLV